MFVYKTAKQSVSKCGYDLYGFNRRVRSLERHKEWIWKFYVYYWRCLNCYHLVTGDVGAVDGKASVVEDVADVDVQRFYSNFKAT